MQEPQCLVFGPFRLDLRDERLWRGHEAIQLSRKTFAVLCCLVTQAGQLVTKEALLEAVWPETVVSESILTVAMRTLRRVLGDQARTPCFIETVHDRGYRFIAPVSATMPLEPSLMTGRPHHPLPATVSRPELFVGRDAELIQLAQWWATVQQGQRQVGCLVGEPGIGKTALVETFIAQVSAAEDVWVGHGQCMDHYGAGEPYLPVLEALGRLCRGPEGMTLITVLRQYAPSWLMHLPTLLAPEDQKHLGHLASGVTPARMLREFAEALEVLTAARPLVLVLEDLHWSDRATLEWLAYVVRRRDPACLLILCTYRPVDVMEHAHPLRAIVAECRHHPQYAELVLDSLSAAAVAAYLRRRCGEQPVPTGLPQLFHQRTGGHPLFLVAMVDALVRQGLLGIEGDTGGSRGALAVLSELVPTSLRQYIEQHLEQLSEADQALLEAASVAGSTFAVAAVAAGIAQTPEPLETRYTALARHGRFIRASGTETWPDGTVTACYQFIHALYHEVVYARVSAGHRVRLHQQIGIRKEVGYGAQARQIAAELALHFMRGHDARRAVHYLCDAGENALRRSAYQEAITHLTMGLEVLATLPETPEHAQKELAVQTTLSVALIATKGWGASEVEKAQARARELSQQMEETPQRFAVLWGLCGFYATRGALPTARVLADQLIELAQRLHDPAFLCPATYMMGGICLFLGELTVARTCLEQGMALYEPQRHHAYAVMHGVDLGVVCLCHAAFTLWLLGYPDQALQRSHATLALAQAVGHRYSLAFGLTWVTMLHQVRGEKAVTQERAETLITLCEEQVVPYWLAGGRVLQGWALAARGQVEAGIARMCQGLAAWQVTGAEIILPYHLSLLAETHGRRDQAAEGLSVLTEALSLAERHEERWWEAELHRLRGDLCLKQAIPDVPQAEACFQQALVLARRQQASSLELRAAMSLSRLWQHQGKRVEACQLLAEVYDWFTEGFDTVDLQGAKALLDELA
jgi:predicted ATPase/DNA-binding winged helix-turn-helix (wHTH) protein